MLIAVIVESQAELRQVSVYPVRSVLHLLHDRNSPGHCRRNDQKTNRDSPTAPPQPARRRLLVESHVGTLTSREVERRLLSLEHTSS
jgi:hypothetical protein